MRDADDYSVTADVHTGAERVARRAVKTAGGEFCLLCPDGSSTGKDIGGASIVVRTGTDQILAGCADNNCVALDGHSVVAKEVACLRVTGREFLLLAPLSIGATNEDIGRARVRSFSVVAPGADNRSGPC